MTRLFVERNAASRSPNDRIDALCSRKHGQPDEE
jgi:hypothetical protein